MEVVIDSMVHLPLRNITHVDLIVLKRQLTVYPRPSTFNKNPEPLKLYSEKYGYISIPREFYFQNKRLDNKEIWKVSEGNKILEMEPIKLRNAQKDLVSDIMVHYKKGGLAGILSASAGAG